MANGIDPVILWDGLSPGTEEAGMEAPDAAVTLAASGSGEITGDYYAFVRYRDRRGNFSSLSPASEVLTAASAGTITYSGVPVPTSSKVTGRQILRNTAGQALVFYVDVDTDDLTSDTLTGTSTDDELLGAARVPIVDTDGRSVTRLNDPPPDGRKAIAAHLDRMFLAGEEEYAVGCVSVTAASLSVTGIGTEWPANFAGRFLYVDGAEKEHEIASCDAVSQTVTLLEAYGGPTNPYARYAIRPPPGERRLVYFSEAGLPESWPATNAISIQEDDDEITGLMVMDAFLYILERRHAYRLTFQESPLTDGYVFLGVTRGCVNPRCFCVVDDGAYLLDESGAYSFDGSKEAKGLSLAIQDLFESDGRAKYRVRWSSARWFHCVYDPGPRLVRWFVTLEGSGLPRHALVYDIQQERWWLEEYPFPVGASCQGRVEGRERVLLGGPGGKVYALGAGALDCIDATLGGARGSVSSSTPLSLTQAGADFKASFAGAPVSIVSGRGAGQCRMITEASASTLRLDRPWLALPDDTSAYQIGGVRYRYRTGWFRWAEAEQEGPRRLEVTFSPLDEEATLAARLYYDRSSSPVPWALDRSSSEQDGVASEDGSPELTIDLTKPLGFVQRRLDAQKELYIDGPRLVSVELEGVGNSERASLHGVTLDGAEQ